MTLKKAYLALTAIFVLYALIGTIGFGNDCDTYSMIKAWSDFMKSGIYGSSRPPGYPLPEMVIGMGALSGGHALANLLSAALGCLALFCFYRLLLPASGHAIALTCMLAIAANPYWIIACTSSMDYVYAAAFFLLGATTLCSGRVLLAAFAFAACAASRLTYLPIILIAYGASALASDRNAVPWRKLAGSAFLFAAIALAAYLPAFHSMGKAMFSVTVGEERVLFFSAQGFHSLIPYLGRFAYKNVALFGLPGCAVLAAIWFRFAKGGLRGRGKIDLAVALTALYTELLFLRLPLEICYLLPVLFSAVYFTAFSSARRHLLTLFIFLQALHGIVDFAFWEKTYAVKTYARIEANGIRWAPGWRRGALWEDLRERSASQAYYTETILGSGPPNP